MYAMSGMMVKPLALVDNKTGHLMLLVDGTTLQTELEGGMTCQLRQDDARFVLDLDTHPDITQVGPFNRNEAEKIRFCHRLTVASFKDGMVVKAREVGIKHLS